ncbi:sugar transferase [bacterium]|nr:sugar transferase [bacterium]
MLDTTVLVGSQDLVVTPVAQRPPTGSAISGFLPRWKRVGDRILAAFLLVATAPVIAVAMVLVKVASRGPAIYSQTRLGLNGRLFTMYKIRTMTHNCEAGSGPRWATPDDPRQIRFGRLLRRTHLDELPQLWNVLRGDMSLVGPRPERPEIVAQFESLIPWYSVRLTVPPGLTGLAQLNLPPDSSIDSVRRKLRYDVHYAANLGVWLDLRLLLTTATTLIGIPFAVSRVILRIPGPDVIEVDRVDAPTGLYP